MRILFYLGHPAHFHLFKNVIHNLLKNKHEVKILIKKKDILEKLLINSNISYTNIQPEGRNDGFSGILWAFFKRVIKIFFEVRKFKPNILIGTSAELAQVGILTKTTSFIVGEDDHYIVPLMCKFGYNFTNLIISPVSCNNGKWKKKSIKYEGLHELAYLHPNNFSPDKDIVNKYFNADKPYFILRFAKLTAHHDVGVKGISDNLALKIIDKLKPHGTVYLTSEREFSPALEPYRIAINPLDMHHVLAHAVLYIGDSQTMAAEAGVLGTPFIRFNDFVGRIGYLNEIELKYALGFGIKADMPEVLLKKISELLSEKDLRLCFEENHKRLLKEKIDVAAFMTWFIENYPQSHKIMKENPDYQYRFK